MQDLDVAWHEGRRPGGVLAVISDDVNQLERFLDAAPGSSCTRSGRWCSSARSSRPRPGSSPCWPSCRCRSSSIGSIRFQRALEPLYGAVRARGRRASARPSSTNLGGLTTIKAFTAEEREVERVRRRQPDYREANRRGHPLLGGLRPADPDGDPRRLHLDPAARRLARARTGGWRSASTPFSSS